MNGAESLIRTAVAAGVEVCFANPGTTEMPIVAALDAVEGIRAVLGLFEGVCTGAADGYGRMADKPAMTLLHLGPGFANGIANLHNARRARSPIVNRDRRSRDLARRRRRAAHLRYRLARAAGVGVDSLGAKLASRWRPTPPRRSRRPAMPPDRSRR